MNEIQAKLFRGFSDPSRLLILAALRDCGLVTAEQQGRFVYYELSDKRVGQLLNLADELLTDVAKGVYECMRYRVKVSKHG